MRTIRSSISRRSFLRTTAAGVTPLVAPGSVLGANDRIRLGVIGIGARTGLLMEQLPKGAEIVALADCHLARCYERRRTHNWDVYQDYRQLLDRNDIDGIIEGTTEHGRALVGIHVCQSGKDLYTEKPLTLYIAEGRALVNAVRRYDRIVQVGSQQRSMAMNQIACEFIRKGGLGRIKEVRAVNYYSPRPSETLAKQTPPPGLDWDMWLGQARMRPYHTRLHYGWMSWRDFGGGQMTNWGAHGLDQVQWALNADGSGPVELWPMEEGPEGAVAFRYESGVTVKLTETTEHVTGGGLLGGARFVGEKGTIEVVRNDFRCDPPELITERPPKEEVDKWWRAQWQAEFHMQEWLGCMRSRKRPSAHIEIGHRSVSVCHLANLTRELNRKLRWNPAEERFIDDAEANQAAVRSRRGGYELPS